MPFTITMPKLSPTMEEGMVVKWHKKIGERVVSGDLLCEVNTDKATIEYNALEEGFLRQIIIGDGAYAKVNAPIAILTKVLEEPIHEYIPEGLVEESPQEEIPRQPTAATTTHIPPAEEKRRMGQPSFMPEPPVETYQFPFTGGERRARVAASPLAKKLAKEKGIDLTTIKGTGPGGRITSRDVDLGAPQSFFPAKGELPAVIPGTYEEVALTPMRKVIAQRLQEAKTFIPHIYVTLTLDAQPLYNAYEQLKTGEMKITLNDMVIRAVALALREHPYVNSGFHSVNQSILLFKTIDIAIAVTVDGGLITPIVRHADYKDIREISTEVKNLAKRAREGKLSPEEYKGGSFTISNLGMFGIDDFCAIINPPQSCILAVGGIIDAPCVKNGQVVAGKKLSLTLSADHRVVDGAEAAKFLKTVQKYLENPSLLLLA